MNDLSSGVCACRDKVYVALRVVISFEQRGRFCRLSVCVVRVDFFWVCLFVCSLFGDLTHGGIFAHVPAGLELRGEVVPCHDHLGWQAGDAVGAGAEGFGAHVGDAGAGTAY